MDFLSFQDIDQGELFFYRIEQFGNDFLVLLGFILVLFSFRGMLFHQPNLEIVESLIEGVDLYLPFG
jgi:hypothetical protein